MKEAKEAMLKTRIDSTTAEAFAEICVADGTTPSEQIRNFVVGQVRRHALTQNGFDIQIYLGDPYGRGARERDEYYISATLSAKAAEMVPPLVPFVLPEFKEGATEPFRVDSFYTHRFATPGSRSATGRLLGAKLVKGKWEGAIFLYKSEHIGNPAVCFPEIRDALKRCILRGLGLYLEAEAAPDQL
jgi:hypothetical protein